MIERYMAEDAANVESFSPQRIAQARSRLAPLSFRRFMPNESRPDNPTQLAQPEVQSKCFAVLGYLEEYHRAPERSVPDIKLGEGEGLQSLERQLDVILKPHQKPGSDHTVVSQEDTDGENPLNGNSEHQELVRQRLSDLLAFPQVRELFEQEFDSEFSQYQVARRPMREVRDIDRVTAKLRQAIYRRYLDSKQQAGKLTQSSADQIGLFQGKLDELELQKRGIEETASPSTVGYLETQKLLEYKKELKEKGFVMTPSREQLIDRITREALSGKKIFLVGSTGTGKTQLAFYALNDLTGGYEIVPWHEGTTPRDIFGYRELYEDEEGRVQSGTKPGPYPRALEKQVGLVHEEFTGGSTRTQLSMKYLMGAKPGEKVHIPGFNGEVHEITPNFIELFTGNPKDERTKQREDMDPAILRELTGIEVSYMPAQEMNDIIRGMLIEESGVLKLSVSEAEYVERLTKAAEMMQRIHNRDFDGFSTEMKSLLGIDPQGNTETTLNTSFLDPGTLFKLFSEWELASARGQKFEEYMAAKIGEFIQDPKTLSTPEERKTLQKVLHAYGLTTNASPDVHVTIEDQEKGYILPSQMAGEIVLSNENPMGVSSTPARERRREAMSEIQIAEQRAWQDVLGAQVDIAPLPGYVTPEIQRRLEVLGMELRFVPNLDLLQSSLGTKSVGEYLQELNALYPNWKPYESLSDREKADHSNTRNLREWFWEQVKANNVNFPNLPGQWMAVETMPKPSYGQKYQSSALTTAMGLNDRFNVSWTKAKKELNTAKGYIKTQAGLDRAGIDHPSVDLRLLTAAEWNLLGNREGWGQTDTYEWVEDEYRGSGDSRRLVVGYSDRGGASYVDWARPGSSGDRVGFRAAVVLGS